VSAGVALSPWASSATAPGSYVAGGELTATIRHSAKTPQSSHGCDQGSWRRLADVLQIVGAVPYGRWVSDHALAWANFIAAVVGSVATVGALVVAIVLGIRESRAIRRENAQRDEERAEEAARQRRAQAECVSAQLHVNMTPGHSGRLTEEGGIKHRFEHHAYVEVYNTSALPIFNVEVETRQSTHPDMTSKADKHYVPGGQTGHIHVAPQPNTDLHESPVGVLFRDAGNRVWHRHEDGYLHEMTDGELDFVEVDRRRRGMPAYEPLLQRHLERIAESLPDATSED
jgi:hypothetical protein